ncbi:TPA: ImmA/IrrE family metallo-endopeptidase [Streptococcus agalactiae]|nr:ImmA/IrrE family metallo-endopeptidase [Streptococcus agalactiae]HEO1892438.1 ImmA/IrrE family metallo-endopeptidase [Streptococcus agalactiae]
MKIDELLKKYKVSLFLFDGGLWERDGFYFPDLRIIYVNDKLSEIDRDKVILHELGHMINNHNPYDYKRLLLQYENQADKYMIRELLKDYLANHDIYSFDWLKFANHYKISTVWGQEMIRKEFNKLI